MNILKKVIFVFGTIVMVYTWSVFAWDKDFGFGIDPQGGEDSTITATRDLAVGGVDKDQEEWLIDNVVKSLVNRVLGILGLIALIVVLYGGFLMLTARDSEENYSKWRKVIKAGIIWLIIIGIAWFILSLIFRLIVQSSDGVWWAGTDT